MIRCNLAESSKNMKVVIKPINSTSHVDTKTATTVSHEATRTIVMRTRTEEEVTVIKEEATEVIEEEAMEAAVVEVATEEEEAIETTIVVVVTDKATITETKEGISRTSSTKE